MKDLAELLSRMHVEELDTNLFRAQSLDLSLPRVFGGQVLGQALNAAVRTVDSERRPHSLHGYFLRPGDVSRPIIYEVDPIRDGRSFSTRRVVAKQSGKAIFNASISFQKIEEGLSHQSDIPKDIPSPDSLMRDYEMAEILTRDTPGTSTELFRALYLTPDPEIVDIRTPNFSDVLKPKTGKRDLGYWFKFPKSIGDDPITHRTLLAFMSDKMLMSTALLTGGISFMSHKVLGASLDHAMWFHDEIRVDQWVYYALESPRAARARGLNHGSFYTQDGTLIASTTQEGLIRVLEEREL